MNFSMALFFLMPMYFTNSMSAYLAYLLTGTRIPYRKVFIWSIPAAIIQSIAFLILMFVSNATGISSTNYLMRAFFCLTETVIRLSWVYFLFMRTDIKKRFFYMSAIFPFAQIAGFATNAIVIIMDADFIGKDFNQVVFTAKMVAQYTAPSLIIHGSIVAIIWLVTKTNFWGKLQAFGSYPRMYIPMGIIYFLVYTAFYTFGLEFTSVFHYIAALNLSYIALLVVAVLLVSDIKRTENLTAAQNLLLQQQNYIHKLETIQQEIRSIQHDYKNMLSGLYAQASEGNAEAVKEYIDTKLLRVDEAVREDMRQMNQLTQIELPELKGLIMTKILEAEGRNVLFKLEVMFPIKHSPMYVEDLLRCVGILLDNAIEEVEKQTDATINLLLLQEDTALTIIVKNTMKTKPNLTRIWDLGYSTKGAGRGVGLSNYQGIVRKYPDVTQETKVEGEYFVQILHSQ